jgi:peptide/nickel transport system ATP-binding protein
VSDVAASGESSERVVVSLDDIEVHFEEGGGLLNLFQEPDVVQAVDGVSLQIPEKDVLALVGESGCGKTTLGKVAVGLQQPTAGTVRYRGEDIHDARRNGGGDIPFEEIRRSLQIIHQDPGSAINPNKKIVTSLTLPLRKWNPEMSRVERRDRVYDMLETVGMTPPDDYANRYPHQLSGGEKQRTVLIRALLMNPDLILADEAISALDVSLRIDMMDLFLDLQEEFDTSFLFISHDLANARYLAENAGGRIGVMYLGEVVEIGPPTELVRNPKHPYTKALKWATPELYPEEGGGLPLRKIDVPDPIDPPSGCRFHTRCPEAREICRERIPESFLVTEATGDETDHRASCFRVEENHDYWDSPPITE